jgi:hypothetical protein
MTKKSEEAATQSSLADDFATTMPAWMPDGLEDEVEAASAAAAAADDAADSAAVTAAVADGSVEGADAPEAATDEAADADDSIVVLPPKARLPQIEDIVERLTAAIDADELVIDAREVEDITTPVVTAIISALNSRADKTPPAAVLAPTPAFVDAFSDLGLFQDLMKMEFRQ